MPIFTVFCLALALIVQIGSPIQNFMVSNLVLSISLGIAAVVIVSNFFKLLSENLSYDLFSATALLAWFAYWKPLFVKDSPIFFFFPVYFALIAAFVTLFFIGQRHKIDRESLKLMKLIIDSEVFEPSMLMIFVLITLYFENHFLQYPVMMTLLCLRYALSGCVKKTT